MPEKSYAKTPAFFRMVDLTTLFEPDETDTNAVVEALNLDVDLDAELDAILAE